MKPRVARKTSETAAAAATRIPRLNESAMAAALERQDRLTKPRGSLGTLESVAVRLSGIVDRAEELRKYVIVFAADHGVAARGVSAYPQIVTAQMLRNFDSGGAAINAIAASVGASLTVVDVGVIEPPERLRRVRSRPVRQGTRDFSTGPAMSRSDAEAAMSVGGDIVDIVCPDGGVMALGEMGIGNTTAAAAITAAVCGCPVAAVTGVGTGIPVERLSHKIAVIETALRQNAPNSQDAIDVLSKVGGLEIAALVGAMIRAAERRMPVVIDGFPVGSAALIAHRLEPKIADFLFAGHCSAEPGHAVQLSWLGLAPLLNLDMRLGEGTGAALALSVIDAAWRAHNSMATFGQAAVSGPDADAAR
jgi:nicotinate-nucleotide--dimethylbenzimidazole phosphoribosyltransferase